MYRAEGEGASRTSGGIAEAIAGRRGHLAGGFLTLTPPKATNDTGVSMDILEFAERRAAEQAVQNTGVASQLRALLIVHLAHLKHTGALPNTPTRFDDDPETEYRQARAALTRLEHN